MKYIVTLFWSFAIGQAVCYLGGALQSGTYNFELSTIISLIVGVIAIIAVRFISPKKAEA
ncbi:YjzD family protein [Enterococcus malodoratus]|uniref:YjzD family protein n=1 Tax=Enterococcus malodoratus TaxID=71451 RepID=UPI003FCF8458